jgi:hypothetical protein
VTSDAKLFPIIFEGNSRAAFFGSKISGDLIRIASSADRTPLRAMFPSHQSFRCIKMAPRKTTDGNMTRRSLRGYESSRPKNKKPGRAGL